VKRHAFPIPASLLLLTAIATSAATPREQARPAASAQVVAKEVGDLTPEEEQQFSDAAEATIARVCIACHPFENIVKARRNLREWGDQVTTMSQRGAPGTPADFITIKKYLVRYYGIVRVNTATAEELSAVLGLPIKAATAIVEYRTTNGTFADLAALEKVAGVDKAKLEEQPEAIRFD
jgi:competence ComEA-like helix-hairpin-helix protein